MHRSSLRLLITDHQKQITHLAVLIPEHNTEVLVDPDPAELPLPLPIYEYKHPLDDTRVYVDVTRSPTPISH